MIDFNEIVTYLYHSETKSADAVYFTLTVNGAGVISFYTISMHTIPVHTIQD